VRDITAQKINEKMLNDSHELLTKLSEQVPGTIYQYQLFADGSSCFPFASEHIRDIYEVTPEEIRHDASKVFSRLHSEDIDNVTETIIRSAESLEPWRCDYRVVLPQKGIRWLRGDANPEKMPDGSVLWHGYILDITDRKNAEDIIHRSEAKFRNVFENAAIGMSRTALNGRFIEVNRRLCEILGYTREELQNITFMDITHPEDLKADLDSTKQLLNGRIDSFSMEKRYITKSGQIIWVRLTSSYVRSPDENYFVSSVEDITDSKRIQLELEDSQEKLRIVNKNLSLMVEEEVNKRLSFEERYKRLFNNINEGLCVHGFDKDKVPTEFVEVNNRMCTMFGYTREELLRMKPAELHTPASLSDMRAKTGIIHKDGSLVFETELMHKNGGTIFCELNSSLMELDGELVVFTSIRDITETRRLKVDNLHKEHLLIQQSKLADMGSMIAAIAHQWKQPLNIIGLAAEVIGAEAENDSDVAEVITTINDQVRYMSETIDDFRNFFIPTKEKHSFSLMKAIQQILRMVQPRMITQNITVCLDGDESITAFGFQNEFMQVVMNIINNARDAIVKKSAKGGRITIGISSEACLTEVRIKDNGGGIPEDLLPDTIFKPYFTTKGNEGTGIGLSIAKTIIEKYMDGTIMAHNTQEGAEFVITLPAYENAVECVRSVKEKCLLYVEDDEFTLAKTSEMLRKHFACVYTAKNGIEGLIVFKRHQDEISAVLTDIDMPELNGIEMSKRLKAIAPDLPIIVLTAVSGEVFEDIGFKAVLDKPVSVRQLITLLHESIDEPTA
jgi:PAS domain S-box-containing protein